MCISKPVVCGPTRRTQPPDHAVNPWLYFQKRLPHIYSHDQRSRGYQHLASHGVISTGNAVSFFIYRQILHSLGFVLIKLISALQNYNTNQTKII